MTVPDSKQPTGPPAPGTTTKPDSAKPSGGASKRHIQSAGGTKNSAAPSKPPVVRPGTKAAKILRLLRRPGGASLQELRKATGWQAHSVRGFLSGALKKKMGVLVHAAKRGNGERVYRARVAAK